MKNYSECTPDFWNKAFDENKLGWDIGYVSTPLKEYFDQLKNKKLSILIPGAGNAYEAEYLFNNGFKNVFVLDFAPAAIQSFLKRFPAFPEQQIFIENFFQHNGKYDLIIEQTFFTSFPTTFREKYAQKTADLLKNNGKLVGLWFTHHFNKPYPPYGGTKEEYKKLFSPYFQFKTFEIAYNSIKPRAGREFFIIMQKK